MITIRSERDTDWLQLRLATAMELTTLRDSDSTLQEIVRHTRGLMRTDMAYVSFTDFDRNETVIRKSDGVRTAEYASLRQPLGSGVLGRVAIGHAPYWSPDYLEDESLHHMGDVDAVVRDEGARALLGAPLTVAGRVIGALVVADRSPREFSEEEVTRLESIAAQAAIAIDNAARHDHAIAVLEELGGQQQRSAAELAIVATASELDRRLMDALASGLALSSMLAIGAKALHADLWLEDFSTRAVAASTASDAAPGHDDSTSLTVTANSERFGRLIASRRLASAEVALLERIGVHLALAIMLKRTREEEDMRQQSEAVSALVDDRVTDHADVRMVLDRVGLPSDQRIGCVLLEKPEPLTLGAVRALTASARVPLVVAAHGQHICALTTDPDWVETLPELFRRHSWTLRAGVDWANPAPGGIAGAHRRAEFALSSLIAQGRSGIADGAEVGLVSALLHLARRGEFPDGVAQGLEPLIAYDRDHRSELVRTAGTYFETNESVARTSEVLGVHRNTVRQRLERIDRLLGSDWLDMPRKLDLQLALRAHAARHQHEVTD